MRKEGCVTPCLRLGIPLANSPLHHKNHNIKVLKNYFSTINAKKYTFTKNGKKCESEDFFALSSLLGLRYSMPLQHNIQAPSLPLSPFLNSLAVTVRVSVSICMCVYVCVCVWVGLKYVLIYRLCVCTHDCNYVCKVAYRILFLYA